MAWLLAATSLGLGVAVGACGDGGDDDTAAEAVPAADARIEPTFTGEGTSYTGDRLITEGTADFTFRNESEDGVYVAVLRFDTGSDELAEVLSYIPEEGGSDVPGERTPDPAAIALMEGYPPGSHTGTIELRPGTYLFDIAASDVLWRAAIIEVVAE